MGYYCNVCKKDITIGEFSYSMDKFGRALCREHQNIERRTQEMSSRIEHQEKPSQTDTVKIDELDEKLNYDTSKSDPESRDKNVVVKMGKGVIKGVKKVADSSKKRSQKRKWKERILRRMTMDQLKSLCFEKKISTKNTVLNDDEESDYYWKKIESSEDNLVSRLKRKVKLGSLISFAKRNRIDIRDILVDRDRKKADWRIKELNEKIAKNGSNDLLELKKSIWEFDPLRRYDKEIYYQDTLASHLKSKYPDTKIEDVRGSTRPDIVVKGIAIEVKGPTSHKELDTIANKCLRYPEYYPKGLICVLFDVNVSGQYYEDWLKTLKNTHPTVVVIRK